MNDRTADLLRQSASGDRLAMEQLLTAYLPELHAFLRLRMGPGLLARESSEDLAQSVCREVLSDLEEFEYRDQASFKKWLFLTAQRKVQDRARFHGRERRAAAREVRVIDSSQMLTGYACFQTPSRVAIRNEEIDQLEAAFDRMPQEFRDVIVYAKILGMSRREIGERMDKSEGAVRVLLHRALVRLGFLLDEDCDD